MFFVSLWTVGMAAMMFPAITPMVLLYSKLAGSKNSSHVEVALQSKNDAPQRQVYPLKTLFFVGGYLAVWSVTGFAMLFGWSALMGAMTNAASGSSILYVYGAVLVVAGAYQFSPLKTRCLGYCESPLSFFMRRWSNGASGAAKMGVFHGLYCLGCCWPYFLLMVALGWMNLLWMALFSGIIFGEKIWPKKGIWVARAAGIGFIIIGILVVVTGGSSIISSSVPVMMPPASDMAG
jgi:predicted metal-binding membrane protein